MIIQEQLENNLICTYSDRNVYIFGGSPQGNYVQAIDPIEVERSYIETNIPIEEESNQTTIEDEFSIAGKILMGIIQ